MVGQVRPWPTLVVHVIDQWAASGLAKVEFGRLKPTLAGCGRLADFK
jgi:hypothetical protein